MFLWRRQGDGGGEEGGSGEDGVVGVGLAEGGLAVAAAVMQDGSEDDGEGGEPAGPTTLAITSDLLAHHRTL